MKRTALVGLGILALTLVAPVGIGTGSVAIAVGSTDGVGWGSTTPRSADIRIEGIVRHAVSGRPVAGAQVFLPGTIHGTVTDAEGRYTLVVDEAVVRDGELTLKVRLVGYQEVQKTVRVGGSRVRADVSLRPSALRLQEVTVSEGVAIRGAPSVDAAAASSPAVRPAGYEMRARQQLRGRYNPNFHTESYARIEENAWLAPELHPLSTFSIDVDRASYSNIRRFIRDGRRPPVDAVRIEEMVNYFPYEYPEADGEHPFVLAADVAAAPWRPAHRLVRIGVQGRRVDMASAPSSNLVFLLDVSGSMRSPDKLPLVKRSLRMLVDALRPSDRVGIVVYAGAAGLVLESTPGGEKERILDAIERLEAGGSTAGGAGIRLAYEVAARNRIEDGNNRVILATDGDFNVGASSDAEMIRLIEEKRDEGVYLTVLGFGTGNLKDSKMEGLADHGNGNYAYIDGLLEARKVLVGEMGGTLLTIAEDVKIQVEFNSARIQAYRLIGYENRLLAAEDFNDDTKDAGELGAGHSVTALYEVVPAGAPPVETGSVDPLRYQRPSNRAGEEAGRRASVAATSDELLFVKLRYKRPGEERSRLIRQAVLDRPEEATTDLRFAAAVAAFGMLLRDSEQCGDFSLTDVSHLARGALGEDPQGYRAEFVRLVEATRELGLLDERMAAAGGG